ncbi:hypothetical protein H1R20_g9649, partial [Candolleomyces eurysporus]
MLKLRESITLPSGERANILNDWTYISPMIMVFFRDGAFYFIVFVLLQIHPLVPTKTSC